MHWRHVLFALVLMACGTERVVSGSSRLVAPESTVNNNNGAGEAARDDAAPYDRLIQKSIHNAYDKDVPLIDQLARHHVRSLELDIHTSRDGKQAAPGNWFVYHADYLFMRNTTCSQLSDCLAQVASFHAAEPTHEVVTLFIDLKDGFTRTAHHEPSDLDAVFANALGRDNIVSPNDVVAMCPSTTPSSSLRDAVTGACHFPTLRTLRGKFLLVTTGGTACDGKSLVSLYGAGDPRERLAFLGPNVNDDCTVNAYDARPNIVFFNMPLSDRTHARLVKSRGLVARIYGGGLNGGLDTEADFSSARAAGAAHLATDNVSSAW